MRCEDGDNYQLRILHVPLNKYLERFKSVGNARRPACGEDSEEVQYFPLECLAM